VSTPTLITLTLDSSPSGVSTICQCYTGTGTLTNAGTGCTNGHGVTVNGDGSVEEYSIP
jgi:hypothetical protein